MQIYFIECQNIFNRMSKYILSNVTIQLFNYWLIGLDSYEMFYFLKTGVQLLYFSDCMEYIRFFLEFFAELFSGILYIFEIVVCDAVYKYFRLFCNEQFKTNEKTRKSNNYLIQDFFVFIYSMNRLNIKF